jgi:hypothetical protein
MVGLSLVLALAACGAPATERANGGIPEPSSTPTPTSPSPADQAAGGGGPATAATCPTVATGFDCDFQRRFAAVQTYLRTRPGTVGIVLRDRRTGAVWRNDHAGRPVWTASTIKLAMTVDLLLRDRAGKDRLTAADRANITAMLHVSDDDAADALWRGHGRAAFADRFPAYGLTGATFVSGFDHYWGFMKCTPNDLDRLIRYVLDKLPADLRSYVVGQLRTVGANQRWGVWGAGAAARPGNKDGWSSEQGGWVINSVGFVGPGERYTLSLMNSLDGEGQYDAGVATVTKVSALLFAGSF